MSRTNVPIDGEPQVLVCALIGVEGQDEVAFYNRATNEVFFFNTSYYGQLKSWTLGAVGRILAEEYGIHSIHGACVAINGSGILYIAPTGTGKTTSSYGLTIFPNTRFHSDDWVYVRYAYPRKSDGKYFAPYRITTRDGTSVRGYQVFGWIKDHGIANADADVDAIGLDNEKIRMKLRELNHVLKPEAFAYISEKKFYLRTNIVESFPYAFPEMICSKAENVPMVTDSYLRMASHVIDNILSDLLTSEDPRVHETIDKTGLGELKLKAARFIAFDNARAILDQSHAFMPHKVVTNPLEPVRIDAVILIKRDFNTDEVLVELDNQKFVERLLKGETPDGRWEIAYNDYRAVDDEEEKAYLKRIFEKAKSTGSSVYEQFEEDRQNRPDTLDQEFELFEVLYEAADCYDLNTILQMTGASKKDAVGRTVDIIREVFSKWHKGVKLKLEHFAKVPSSY